MKRQSYQRRNRRVILVAVFSGIIAYTTLSATAASNKNVWIYAPVYTKEAVQNHYTCIGVTEDFWALTTHESGHSWSWQYKSPEIVKQSEGQGEAFYERWAVFNFTTSGGPWNIIATYKGEASHAARVTVVKVESLTPSAGLPWDDGDGNPNTATYLVQRNSPTVTVTATPSPSVSEANLPWCWGFSGGDAVGSGKLQRQLTPNQTGTYVFQAVSGSSVKTVTIIVYYARFGLLADEGNRLFIDVGHSWWQVYLSTEARNLINASDRQYVDYGGFWPSGNKLASPGLWIFGDQDHGATGAIYRDATFSEVTNAVAYIKARENANPAIWYYLPTWNCTHEAVKTANDALGFSVPSYSTPWGLSDWLNSQ